MLSSALTHQSNPIQKSKPHGLFEFLLLAKAIKFQREWKGIFKVIFIEKG